MILSIHSGNILDFPSDVLVTPANPWLTMSSGVNGEIVGRCGMSMQDELNAYLEEIGLKAVPGGTVVPTQALGLPFKHVIHAVAVDAFDDSSEALVAKTLKGAFGLVAAFTVDSVSVPPLATGYGPISLESFLRALGQALNDSALFAEKVQLVLEDQDQADQAKQFLMELPIASKIDIR